MVGELLTAVHNSLRAYAVGLEGVDLNPAERLIPVGSTGSWLEQNTNYMGDQGQWMCLLAASPQARAGNKEFLESGRRYQELVFDRGRHSLFFPTGEPVEISPKGFTDTMLTAAELDLDIQEGRLPKATTDFFNSLGIPFNLPIDRIELSLAETFRLYGGNFKGVCFDEITPQQDTVLATAAMDRLVAVGEIVTPEDLANRINGIRQQLLRRATAWMLGMNLDRVTTANIETTLENATCFPPHQDAPLTFKKSTKMSGSNGFEIHPVMCTKQCWETNYLLGCVPAGERARNKNQIRMAEKDKEAYAIVEGRLLEMISNPARYGLIGR